MRVSFQRVPEMLFFLVLSLAGSFFFVAASRSLEQKQQTAAIPVPIDSNSVPDLPAAREYDSYILNKLDSTGTVGAAYTIVHDGKIILTRTHGVRRRGSPEQVDEHTVFRLASVSKGFAGALACLLEHDGIISLDEKVAHHYPGFRLKDSASTADLTIRHLLSHTSGLVPHAFDNLVEAGQDLDTIIRRLPEVDIAASPGALYGYQNVLFSMLDPILKSITGKDYPDLIKERIFLPLGMKDASAGEMDAFLARNMAFPHLRGKNGYVSTELHTGYYNVIPAAGINASIADMGQWLLALLGEQPAQFPRAVCDTLSTPLIYTPLKARYTRAWQPFRERYYSLGWRIYHYRDRDIVYHGGYVRGYRAEIAFCPEEGLGISFLQNSPNDLASESIPAFFDRYFDGRDKEGSISEKNKP